MPVDADDTRTRVAVLYGGRSAEHEISIISARFVARHLDPARFAVVPIGIDQEGRWLLPPGGARALESGAVHGDRVVPEADRRLVRCDAVDTPAAARAGTDATRIDVVFPVLHGPYGEDGTVQGLLELAGIPYVGAGVLGSSLGMDKAAQKQVLAAHGLPTARFRLVRASDWRRTPERVLAGLEADLGYPLFVKPANLGSSVGITLARDREQLDRALTTAAAYDLRLVAEEALANVRELECAVIGNDDPQVSVVGEIRTAGGYDFYDYQAKYLDEHGAELRIPADIPPAVTDRVRELAREVFLALDCAGMARVDLFARDAAEEVWVNEINTIPGFTSISMFPRLWEASGLPPDRLVARLVELAIERHAARRALRTRR